MAKFKTPVHAQEYIMYYLTNNSTINKFYYFTIYLRQILTEISPGLVYRFLRIFALLPNVILARLYPPLIDLVGIEPLIRWIKIQGYIFSGLLFPWSIDQKILNIKLLEIRLITQKDSNHQLVQNTHHTLILKLMFAISRAFTWVYFVFWNKLTSPLTNLFYFRKIYTSVLMNNMAQ